MVLGGNFTSSFRVRTLQRSRAQTARCPTVFEEIKLLVLNTEETISPLSADFTAVCHSQMRERLSSSEEPKSVFDTNSTFHFTEKLWTIFSQV